jgi:hypothetical protein
MVFRATQVQHYLTLSYHHFIFEINIHHFVTWQLLFRFKCRQKMISSDPAPHSRTGVSP